MSNEITQLTVEQNKNYFEGLDCAEYVLDSVNKVIVKMSKKYIKDNVLEIGSATGTLLKYAQKDLFVEEVVGIDIAPKSISVRQGDCTNLEFNDNSFDTIFCKDVIEHLCDGDLIKCLMEIYRVLKPNCYAIFVTNNNERIAQRSLTCPNCKFKFHPTGHCQTFNKERIELIFPKFGFKVCKTKIANFGFVATFGWLAKLFYLLQLHKLKPCYRITSDIYFVVKKIA